MLAACQTGTNGSFYGVDIIHICLSHLGVMMKEKKFKLPSMTNTIEVLHEGKEEDSNENRLNSVLLEVEHDIFVDLGNIVLLYHGI